MELTEGGATGRLHLGGGGLELSGAMRRDGEVQPGLEGAVLPRVHPPLQVLDRRQCAADRRVGRARLVELGGPQVDELPLEERDDPRGRQTLRMPADRHVEAGRHEPEQPARVQVPAWEAMDVPGAMQAGVVPPPSRGLLAVPVRDVVVGGRLVHVRCTQHSQGPRHRFGRPRWGDDGHLAALCGRGGSEGAGELEVPETAISRVRGNLVRLGIRRASRHLAEAGLKVDDDLEGGVEAV